MIFGMAGRPRIDRPTIVPVITVMTNSEIRAESWQLRSLSENLRTADLALIWLATRQMLKNDMICTVCNVPCQLKTYSHGVDGKRWSCELCNKKISVRERSFFTRSHLSLQQITLLMYCFSQDFSQSITKTEVGIEYAGTMIDWFNFCRKEIGTYLKRHATEIGGFTKNGESLVVEIDETKYFHHNYRGSQRHGGHSVFGGIERGSGRCFLLQVSDCTRATVEAAICTHVLPGTRIVSGNGAAYKNIHVIGGGIYDHSVVVHDRSFVDRDGNEVHTQSIENLWLQLEKKLKRQFGKDPALFLFYLKEFEFRCRFRNGNIFAEFLIIIAEQYPV